MNNTNDFLSKLQFYPCKNAYTGCDPQNDYHSKNFGSGNSVKPKNTQKKIPIFISGDCSAPSI